MFDNSNPYTLRKEIVEGFTRYYVLFIDGQAVYRETEVSQPVYLEFLRFIKTERNLRRWDERHIEQSDLSEEMLYRRAFLLPKSADEMALDLQLKEILRRAIQDLPDTQRRRFILYHEFGLTYERIAMIEGCKKQSVCEAVFRAEEKIKKIFKKNENQP